MPLSSREMLLFAAAIVGGSAAFEVVTLLALHDTGQLIGLAVKAAVCLTLLVVRATIEEG